MKTLLIICILAFCQPLLLAKLIIADTIGQEKAVRILASKLNPDRNIDIKPAKLSDALRELRQGKVDMVLSRYKLDTKQRIQLKVNCYRYALEPVVFVASSRNRITNINKKQLLEILKGNIITWRPLGGEAYSIHLGIVKEGQPGIRALHKNLLKKKEIKAKYFEVSDAKGISVLASMQTSFLGACGYTPLPLAAKFLSVNKVRPTIENIRSGKYPLVTEYWIWISDRKDHKKKLNHKASMEFIDLLRSKKTALLLERCGLLTNKSFN